MEQDNLPIGTAQEPVEEAHHPPVRTLAIHNDNNMITHCQTLIFCLFRSTAIIKITAEGRDVVNGATKKAKQKSNFCRSFQIK